MRVEFILPDSTREEWYLDVIPRENEQVLLEGQSISFRVRSVTWFVRTQGLTFVSLELV